MAPQVGREIEAHGLPFVPIVRPEALFDDPHLLAAGGPAAVRLNDGSVSKVPLPGERARCCCKRAAAPDHREKLKSRAIGLRRRRAVDFAPP